MAQDAPRYLVEVVAGPKQVFQNGDKPGCPGAASCRRRGYVVAGDTLVASEVQGDFTSVTFVPKGGGAPSSGWIETRALRRVDVPAPRNSDWRGTWSGWEASIEITPGPSNGVHIDGQATWGSQDPVRVANGSVHVGELQGDYVPSGDRILYADGDDPGDEYGCRATLQLLGPYMLVDDNNRCGGLNVSFTGVYRR